MWISTSDHLGLPKSLVIVSICEVRIMSEPSHEFFVVSIEMSVILRYTDRRGTCGMPFAEVNVEEHFEQYLCKCKM